MILNIFSGVTSIALMMMTSSKRAIKFLADLDENFNTINTAVSNIEELLEENTVKEIEYNVNNEVSKLTYKKDGVTTEWYDLTWNYTGDKLTSIVYSHGATVIFTTVITYTDDNITKVEKVYP